MRRDLVVEKVAEALRGKRVLLAGGTGSVGKTILKVLLEINRKTGAGAEVTVLSRRAPGLAARHPELMAPGVELLAGDACGWEAPARTFDHVIHAATESGPRVAADPAYHLLQTIHSTESLLRCARACRAEAFLLLSSGAVYGSQPADLETLPEGFGGAPDPLDPASAYGQSKRIAEQLCSLCGREEGLKVKVARIFSFVGEYVPLDAQLAVGNFLRDALERDCIQLEGSGHPLRSYLYGDDLGLWLLRILTAGRPGVAYNVGSDAALSLVELAELTGRLLAPGHKPVRVAGGADAASQRSRYIPSIERARTELGVEVWTPLPEALLRTAEGLGKGPRS